MREWIHWDHVPAICTFTNQLESVGLDVSILYWHPLHAGVGWYWAVCLRLEFHDFMDMFNTTTIPIKCCKYPQVLTNPHIVHRISQSNPAHPVGLLPPHRSTRPGVHILDFFLQELPLEKVVRIRSWAHQWPWEVYIIVWREKVWDDPAKESGMEVIQEVIHFVWVRSILLKPMRPFRKWCHNL